MTDLRRRGRRIGADRPAFVFIDVAIGLALLGLIAFAIAAAVGRQQRAAQRLSDTRAASRLADDALTALRAGRALQPDAEETVKVTRLPDASPQGQAWARATARVGTSDAQVIGLVPATSVPAAGEDVR